MAYGVLQKNRFSRQYKKLHDNVSRDVDAAVAEVADNPSIGERKKAILPAFSSISFIAKINYIYLDTQLMMAYAWFT